MIILNKELKNMRLKLLFSQLENEVILNELTEQRKELLNNSSMPYGFFVLKLNTLNSKIEEVKRDLRTIQIELDNIKIISELNKDNIF